MIGFFSRHYRTLLYVLISLVVIAGIGALVYFIWYRPSQQRGEGARVAGRKRKSASATECVK
jgi:hypothetical protein